MLPECNTEGKERNKAERAMNAKRGRDNDKWEEYETDEV